MSDKFFKKYFPKKYFENNKILQKSILKIQNKILFCIFKIKYYFQNTILHITAFGGAFPKPQKFPHKLWPGDSRPIGLATPKIQWSNALSLDPAGDTDPQLRAQSNPQLRANSPWCLLFPASLGCLDKSLDWRSPPPRVMFYCTVWIIVSHATLTVYAVVSCYSVVL